MSRMTRPKWLAPGLVAFLIVVCAFCAAFPPVKIRVTERRKASAYLLKDIVIAMHIYHDVHGKLPPAVVRSKDGKPLYSWRVLLLPYLEHDILYRQFKLDEPWDSPANRKLCEKTPYCYDPMGLNGDPPGTTRYQVFVGPGTAFEKPGLGLANDFPDGTDNTLLVTEGGEPVPWAKPGDLEFDPDGPLPKLGVPYVKPVYFLGYKTREVPGFNIAFARGSVRFVRSDTNEEDLRAMITRNGGEKVALPPE